MKRFRFPKLKFKTWHVIVIFLVALFILVKVPGIGRQAVYNSDNLDYLRTKCTDLGGGKIYTTSNYNSDNPRYCLVTGTSSSSSCGSTSTYTFKEDCGSGGGGSGVVCGIREEGEICSTAADCCDASIGCPCKSIQPTGQHPVCFDSTCTFDVVGDGICGNGENCHTSPSDCACGSGKTCTQSGTNYYCKTDDNTLPYCPCGATTSSVFCPNKGVDGIKYYSQGNKEWAHCEEWTALGSIKKYTTYTHRCDAVGSGYNFVYVSQKDCPNGCSSTGTCATNTKYCMEFSSVGKAWCGQSCDPSDTTQYTTESSCIAALSCYCPVSGTETCEKKTGSACEDSDFCYSINYLGAAKAESDCKYSINSHYECQEDKCVLVDGAGTDECLFDAACAIAECGNGVCNSGEDIDNCPEDCGGTTPGNCPVKPPTDDSGYWSTYFTSLVGDVIDKCAPEGCYYYTGKAIGSEERIVVPCCEGLKEVQKGTKDLKIALCPWGSFACPVKITVDKIEYGTCEEKGAIDKLMDTIIDWLVGAGLDPKIAKIAAIPVVLFGAMFVFMLIMQLFQMMMGMMGSSGGGGRY